MYYSFQMLLYLLLLLLASSTGTYAQRVTNFDYFDFDGPLSATVLPRGGGAAAAAAVAASSGNRGRGEVNSKPGTTDSRTQTTTPVPILQQINE